MGNQQTKPTINNEQEENNKKIKSNNNKSTGNKNPNLIVSNFSVDDIRPSSQFNSQFPLNIDSYKTPNKSQIASNQISTRIESKSVDNIDKKNEIIDNFFKKTHDLYRNAQDLIKQNKYKDALLILEKSETALMKLNHIVLDRENNEDNQNALKKIFMCLEVIEQKKNYCFVELEKERNIKTYFKKDTHPIKTSIINNQSNNHCNNNINNTNKREDYTGTCDTNHTANTTENTKKSKIITDNDLAIEKINSEIMVKESKIKFDDIIGLSEIKQILQEIIILPSLRPDLFTGLRSPPRGLLLFGPPGTGKTLIAKAVASEIKSTFFNISASSLTSKYVGDSEKLVRTLFEQAAKNQPAIIFIDEIDSILSKRSDNENDSSKRLKTEFLVQFDGVNSNLEDKILVIAATNRPQDLDYAVLRRLPKRVYIGPLDMQGRVTFFKNILKNVDHNLQDIHLYNISKLTLNYSNSDLKELCREAAFQPIREIPQSDMKNIKKIRPLVVDDFYKAVKTVRGTLNDKLIEELQIWNKEYGSIA